MTSNHEAMMRHVAIFNSDEARSRTDAENAKLRAALRAMVDAFRPFTTKPMGAPGSTARLEQEAQTAAHRAATAALGVER